MVEWASGGAEQTFNQSAANGKQEPILLICCLTAHIWFRETNKSAYAPPRFGSKY